MVFNFLSDLLIIVAFFAGFYLGCRKSGNTLPITEDVKKLKEIIPKRKGPVVIDTDEAELEKREKKEEKELLTVDDILKENERREVSLNR